MAETQEKTPEQLQHESNKLCRQGLGFAHYILNYQVKWMFEQMSDAKLAIDVLAAYCHDLQQKIEKVEPPVKQQESKKKGPFEIEVPPVKVTPEAEA